MEISEKELDRLRLNKESGHNYRKRRQSEWLENYTFYRDKVTINRLTQRQSVHIPIMKQTIKTLLKDVDDMPVLYFENLDNDKEAEVFQNEYWKWIVEQNNLSVQDIVDKKQVFLFGRSFMQIQIADGKVLFTVQDPQHMLVDRYVDPTDMDSARFFIHTHIYLPLSVIKQNPKYNKDEIKKLEDWFKSEEGIIQQKENEEMAVEEARKMEEMGLEDAQDPVLGETLVELSLHFNRHAEKGDSDEQFYMYTEAQNQAILLKEPLEQAIGTTKDNYWRTHLPYNSWADDIERQDFWSDAIADIVRTPNKVADAWWSQLVENRTLKNFNMNFYDGTADPNGDFAPQTFVAQPWGWYKLPGDPNKIMKNVPVADLSESLDELQFLMETTEKATGATNTQQGNVNQRQITLGEVQLALGEAKERIKGMSKFYTPAWKERGEKFLKLIEAASGKLDAVTVYKKGRETNRIFNKKIGPTDWATESGYQAKVWSQDEKDANDSESLQKLNAVATIMPNNSKLDEVYKRKLLEFADLQPAEINEIMEVEREQLAMPSPVVAQASGGMGQKVTPAAPPPTPARPMV